MTLGISYPKGLKIHKKENKQTIIYLARINKQKGALEAIEAFSIVEKEIANCQLWIVGSGVSDYITMLRKKISDYKIVHSVKFLGFVSEKRKFELLSKAHILIVPSVHEGWGLTVPEAGSVGTPAIVYDVPGLRDVVRDGINGIIVNKTPAHLAEGIREVFTNKSKYQALCNGAKKESEKYNWDKTAEVALEVLNSKLEFPASQRGKGNPK